MANLFSVVCGDRTRGNGHRVDHRKFRTNMQNFFTVRVTEHWNRLPREVVESPSLEIFKTFWMPTWATCSREPDLAGGLDPIIS